MHLKTWEIYIISQPTSYPRGQSYMDRIAKIVHYQKEKNSIHSISVLDNSQPCYFFLIELSSRRMAMKHPSLIVLLNRQMHETVCCTYAFVNATL